MVSVQKPKALELILMLRSKNYSVTLYPYIISALQVSLNL